MLLLFLFLLLILVFFIICAARALRFRPFTRQAVPSQAVAVDLDSAVSHLQAMIRCRTVSLESERDEAEFSRFRALLPAFYPALFSICEAERVDSTGLLIRWPGLESDAPAVFLSHYDVVPADGRLWEHPPFSGDLAGGVIWGRGTLDMKSQLCAVFEAADSLCCAGFTPQHDIYIALSGEEEIMGPSSPSICALLSSRGIRPSLVIDEGGDILDRFFPGTNLPCALVGIGEKGSANLTFRCSGPGGHSAIPTRDNPLLRLCRAMQRLEHRPFPIRSCSALDRLIDTMGRYTAFPCRLLLANRDLLRPLYRLWLRRQGGILEASARTTFALTRAEGSTMGNVIPAEASMFANLRLLWGDTQDSVIRRLQRIISDPSVSIEASGENNPKPDSLLGSPYELVRMSIEETWPDAVVTPYLMVGCSDARHWRTICDHVYRFSGKYVTGAEKATVHGSNERIRTETVRDTIIFFYRMMRRC